LVVVTSKHTVAMNKTGKIDLNLFPPDSTGYMVTREEYLGFRTCVYNNGALLRSATPFEGTTSENIGMEYLNLFIPCLKYIYRFSNDVKLVT